MILAKLPPMGLAMLAAVALSAPALATPNVVTSIKPLHALVASVMQGIGTPDLIIDGTGSPHTYAMKPSDAANLQQADVIFWIGPELETFLVKPIESLGSKAKNIAFMDQSGLNKLPLREGNGFDHHDHAEGEAEQHEGDHEEFDVHIWLDPDNAKQMLKQISKTLGAVDPANAGAYAENAVIATASIDQLDTQLKSQLLPMKEMGFIVFHDAYQYFEKHYGFAASGAISINPENPPGAAGIIVLQEKLRGGKVKCVFAEPQFDNKLVTLITEGTNAKSATLDPLGVNLQIGPTMYAELLQQLASSFAECAK